MYYVSISLFFFNDTRFYVKFKILKSAGLCNCKEIQILKLNKTKKRFIREYKYHLFIRLFYQPNKIVIKLQENVIVNTQIVR